jgi:hypothetical protein
LVDRFFPFIPGGVTISSDTILCLLQCCSLLICYECRGFYGGPILEVLIVVSKISFVHLPVFGRWYLPLSPHSVSTQKPNNISERGCVVKHVCTSVLCTVTLCTGLIL